MVRAKLPRVDKRVDKQVVGNTGLYYVCYQLSRRGWNVMPTVRNVKGIDLLAYSQSGRRKLALQVKSLTKRAPVPLGVKRPLQRGADFWIICQGVSQEAPICFVLTPDEVDALTHTGQNEAGLPSR